MTETGPKYDPETLRKSEEVVREVGRIVGEYFPLGSEHDSVVVAGTCMIGEEMHVCHLVADVDDAYVSFETIPQEDGGGAQSFDYLPNRTRIFGVDSPPHPDEFIVQGHDGDEIWGTIEMPFDERISLFHQVFTTFKSTGEPTYK